MISLMEKNAMSRTWLVNCGFFEGKRERKTIAGFQCHAVENKSKSKPFNR